MSRLHARTTLAFIALFAFGCDKDTPDGPYARARVIGGLDEAIGGEKGVAREGDIVIENDQIRLAVLAARTSMGPSLYGGSLVDADLQWNDAAVDGARGRDQWNELFPTFNMNVPAADETQGGVTIVSDGADGEAVVRVSGKAVPFLDLLYALWPLVQMPDMWMTHDYVITPGNPWMLMRSTVSFADVDTLPVEGVPVDYPIGGLDVVGDGLDRGLVAGDFFLSGGSLDVFAPGIGFDEDGAVFEASERGENTFATPFEFPFVAGVGDGISYGIVPKEGNAYVPLFSSSQTVVVSGSKSGAAEGPRFGAADAFTYERYFLIGHGDIGSIVDSYVQVRGIPHGRVEGKVIEQGTSLPMTDADVMVFVPGADKPWSQWRTDVRPDDGLADGSFAGALPVGTWEVMFHRLGRPDSPRQTIEVTEGGTVKVLMQAPRAGVLSFIVRDETGLPVPSKVSIYRADPSAPTSRSPALGDSFIAGTPEWVVFAEQGVGEAPLPDGQYYAVASRGMEYELDRSEVFTIDATRARQLDLQVVRAVDTSGWISADLHVHSAPSHDSGVTLHDRVRSMVCEGVEFFSSTDHDFQTDFAPIVEQMGLETWVQSAVGVETTTIEQGHFLGFPLRRDFLGDAGGALDWQGLTPQEIIDGVRGRGKAEGFDPVVFVAHPRDGILGYFDQYGFEPMDGQPGAPVFSGSLFYTLAARFLSGVNEASKGTLDYDAMEMFTAKRLDTHRTPTQPEAAAWTAEYQTGDEAAALWSWVTRTAQEQADLSAGVIKLDVDNQGVIDDWFTLLNLGYRITALGNSDTHGMTSVEAGCPRNFVMSSTDDPGFLDDQEVADAIKQHKVIATYGPFVRMTVEGADIGSDVTMSGEVEIDIEVEAPSWVAVDRVELYENGVLVQDWTVDGGTSNLRFSERVTRTPAVDAWYVVIVAGNGDMDPVCTPVEIPPIPLDEAVTGALGGLEIFANPTFSDLLAPVRYPKAYPVLPYAITNPVWVDVDGGGFTPAGRPSFMSLE